MHIIFTIFIHARRSISSVRSQLQVNMATKVFTPWPRKELKRSTFSVSLCDAYMIVTNMSVSSLSFVAER